MTERLAVSEIMDLYQVIPNLILYRDDFFSSQEAQDLREVLRVDDNKALNPLDVVMESLVNVLSEKFSIDTVTESRATAYLDDSIRKLAIDKILYLTKSDKSFFRRLHSEWLEKVRNFIQNLPKEGAQSIQEVVFQVSLRFRISATSSLKAIATIVSRT